MKIIDSHCHCHYFDFSFFFNENWDLSPLIFLLNVGTQGDDSKTWVENHFLLENNKIYHYNHKIRLGYSVGFHPCEEKIIDYDILNSMVGNAMAIGEIGFDNGEKSPSMDHQRYNFHSQMKVALHNQLPVVIHCRDAWDIFFEETKNYNHHPMVIHCFTGDVQVAQKLIDEYNCLISISGIVTYKNADAIRKAVEIIPIERLLVETDSPFLTPYNYRKQGTKENNPSLILETVGKISQLKNISMEQVAFKTTENFLKFFNLEENLKMNH